MSSITPLSSSYQVESICLSEASEFELSVISTKAAAWEEIALRKAEQKSNEQEIFAAAADIAYGLHACVRGRASEAGEHTYFLLCKDTLGKIQAIALSHIFPDAITIVSFITHPHNIRSSLNEKEPERIFGAGRAIVTHLKEIMRKKASIQQIVVDAFDSSIGFYEKMGFLLQPNLEKASTGKLCHRMVLLRESVARSDSSS